MKNVFIIIAALLALITAPLERHTAVAAVDAPHNLASASVDCTLCHVPVNATPPTWSLGPWSGDNTKLNLLCGSCHDNPSSIVADEQYNNIKTHSAANTGSSYDNGTWTVECVICHNPHYQRQQRAYLASGYIESGVTTAATTSMLLMDQGKTWTPGQWKKHILVPNRTYPTLFYEISDNTATTITVRAEQSGMMTRYVGGTGTSYGIKYGKLINDTVTTANGVKSVLFFSPTGTNSFADGGSALDGICVVCHTSTLHFRANGAAPDQLHISMGSSMAGKKCTACHLHSGGFRQSAACLDCHSISVGARAAVTPLFKANSHHIQGQSLSNTHCYQCHWEANSDGTINSTYHGGWASPGAPVNLVIYQAGQRPTSYVDGVTALQYTADGSRSQIAGLTTHCLACHSDQNNDTQPFGDGKTPRQYAWDGTSVAARYLQTDTTVWGKYGAVANAAPKNLVKAYSAHGNAVANQRGWNTSSGLDAILSDTSGTTNVQCFDCHNSHGSTASGVTTKYASSTLNGGILKDTSAGLGGYQTTYQPVSGGSMTDKNLRNAGASLCMDCHLNSDASSTPWGYFSTFGAMQAVLGYWDSAYFAPGAVGAQVRFPYKAARINAGGHFGASSALTSSPAHAINGLCTACHDPHGVSPTLGANEQYAVPLLKGTWMTSPYKEDVAPAGTGPQSYLIGDIGYHIDQNTFGTDINSTVTGIAETEAQFAGLCLDCHAKSSLTGNTHTWKSKDRIHESVKGWKTANGTIQHNYVCSKCHAPHNGSVLPRLMVTNCFNSEHKGRVAYNPAPVVSGVNLENHTGSNTYYGGSGSGRIPGNYSGTRYGTHTASCHEGNTGSGTDQSWNEVTRWIPVPTTISGLAAGPFSAVGNNVQAMITWTTDVPSSTSVEYGLTPAYGATAGNAQIVTAHSITLTGLTNHSLYYYRAQSGNFSGSVSSGGNTFSVSVPPTVPTPMDVPDAVCASSCSVTLQWNASTDPDNGPIQYQVEADSSAAFTSADKQTSPWISAPTASWVASLATNKRWYFRARSRDANHTSADDPTSAWSPTPDSFLLSDGNASPATTLSSPSNGWYTWTPCDYGTTWVPFSWGDVPPLTEYMVQVDDDPLFGSPNYAMATWQTGTSWGADIGIGTWYWRAGTRDPLNTGTVNWSEGWSFTIYDGGLCSCPALYIWDGGTFAFETDVYASGALGRKSSTGFVKPNPREYHLLAAGPQPLDGYYAVKFVEEREETDYLDRVKLYSVDYPADRDVYQEIRTTGYEDPAAILHTASRNPQSPLSFTHINTGEDVASKLLASDKDYLVLNDDRNLVDWHTVEIDLGDLSQAPAIKLIIDAETVIPSTKAGKQRANGLVVNGMKATIQVPDANGNWTLVKKLPEPQEFGKPYIVDISNIFLTSVYKVRLSFLYKTYLDAVFFDTTVDEPVTVNEVPLIDAQLGYYGFSEKAFSGELYRFIYGSKVSKDPSRLAGDYTRYGDVTALLTGTDDKFAIYGSGDELTVRFSTPVAGPEGTLRRFLIYTDGYYKSLSNTSIANTVDPLPFDAMSSFPYDPAVENYPADRDHKQYLKEYNTRTY